MHCSRKISFPCADNKKILSAAPETFQVRRVVHQVRMSERIIEQVIDETDLHAMKEVFDVAKVTRVHRSLKLGVNTNKRSCFVQLKQSRRKTGLADEDWGPRRKWRDIQDLAL